MRLFFFLGMHLPLMRLLRGADDKSGDDWRLMTPPPPSDIVRRIISVCALPNPPLPRKLRGTRADTNPPPRTKHISRFSSDALLLSHQL